MRKSTFFLFLLSVLLLGTTEVIASGGSYTHTNTPIELEPTSLNNSYQTAAVCFLGQSDCSAGNFGKGDDDMDVNTGNQCKNEGFSTTCPDGWHPEIGKDCPYDPSYKKCCKETCPNNTSTTCTGEAVGDDGCGYTCKKCCVASCPAEYKYVTIPSGYIQDGAPCMSCSLGTIYKVKINPCNGFSTCPYGAALGATSCLSGTTTKYDKCKPCSEDCPTGTTESSPGGCGGFTQNECKTKTCYYGYQSCCDNSCNGYDDAYWSCADGYHTYINGCTNTCYKCKNCNCKGSANINCPYNSPYMITPSKDECGNYCSSCVNAKVYVMFSYKGCNMQKTEWGNRCYYRQRLTKYKYVRYDGETRIENEGWGHDSNFIQEFGDSSNCNWCNTHNEANPYTYLTKHANY